MALVNGFEDGCANVVVAEGYRALLRAGHELEARWPPSSRHHTAGMRCLLPFCIGNIAVGWWAVVHSDSVAHVFVVLVSLLTLLLIMNMWLWASSLALSSDGQLL
jgi:hypothetical protein